MNWVDLKDFLTKSFCSDKDIQYGFSYRGNGYGYWETIDEAIDRGAIKMRKENNPMFIGIPFTLWICKNNKPLMTLNNYLWSITEGNQYSVWTKNGIKLW